MNPSTVATIAAALLLASVSLVGVIGIRATWRSGDKMLTGIMIMLYISAVLFIVAIYQKWSI